MPSRVLLCSPTYFEVRDRKNPYMRLSVDLTKAQQQWDALCQAFRSAGLELEFIKPVKDLEDMVFAANQVFVGSHEKLGNFVVPSEMRYPSRQKEVPYYVDWFQTHGYKTLVLDLQGEYLEVGETCCGILIARESGPVMESDHPVQQLQDLPRRCASWDSG